MKQSDVIVLSLQHVMHSLAIPAPCLQLGRLLLLPHRPLSILCSCGGSVRRLVEQPALSVEHH